MAKNRFAAVNHTPNCFTLKASNKVAMGLCGFLDYCQLCGFPKNKSTGFLDYLM